MLQVKNTALITSYFSRISKEAYQPFPSYETNP